MFSIKIKKLMLCLLVMNVATIIVLPATPLAEEQNYHLGTVVNTGKDNGYTEQKVLEINDPHYGWKLGDFFVSGYTRVTKDNKDNPVFLKNLGDKVTLSFTLIQDINKLNDDKTLSINEDKNGYDIYFGINKTNFGRGTVIIRHTDFRNIENTPEIYTNYLPAIPPIGIKCRFKEDYLV